MITLIGLILTASLTANQPALNTYQIQASPGSRLHLALHCAVPRKIPQKGILFIHGASFPTMLAAGFEFAPRDSWIYFMERHGFLSCGLDFLGYGNSSRPMAMMRPQEDEKPLIRADEAAGEISKAISFMRSKFHLKELNIIAHSWGTIPAAEYVSRTSINITSLTLFGPIVPIPGSKPKILHIGWFRINATQRLKQLYFKDILPKGMVLIAPSVTRNWAKDYSSSAPHVPGDPPGAVRIPAGPIADILAAHAGSYPYNPSNISTPIFAIYGNFDAEANDKNTSEFLRKFTNAPLKWRLRIDNGTHVMHLERNRWSLYEAVYAFIRTSEKLNFAKEK